MGITLGSSDILILSSVPDILITRYPTLAKALLGCWKGEVKGVLIPALVAYAYCADFYQGRLKVVTPPLTEDGLRLLVRKGRSQELLEDFNRGLEEVRASGEYNRLQEKWGLNLEVGPSPNP